MITAITLTASGLTALVGRSLLKRYAESWYQQRACELAAVRLGLSQDQMTRYWACHTVNDLPKEPWCVRLDTWLLKHKV